jgi:hypothetical protein
MSRWHKGKASYTLHSTMGLTQVDDFMLSKITLTQRGKNTQIFDCASTLGAKFTSSHFSEKWMASSKMETII